MRCWQVVLVMVVLGALVPTGLPVQAQFSPWTAWLYNANGTMTRVSSDGLVLQQVTLPTVPGQDYPPQVAVSRGGQYVAYVTANRPLNAHRLVLFNLDAESVLTDFVATDLLETSFTLNVSPLVFDETDSSVAIGLAGTNGAWRILVIGASSGRVFAELRSDSEAVRALALPAGTGSIPVVWLFGAGRVAFTMQQVGGSPADEFGSYLWNIGTGEVQVNTLYPGLDNDLLPTTGEILTPLQDLALANNDAAFGGVQQNTLQVVESGGRRRFPFHYSPDSTLAAPRFIQHGERVLAAAADSTGAMNWVLLDRSGDVVGTASLDIAELFNLVDGFLYLTSGDPAVLMVVNTRDGLDPGTPVGQGDPGARLQLAWAADAAIPPQVAYPPWRNLLEPTSEDESHADEGDLGILPIAAPPTEAPFFVAPTPALLPTIAAFESRLVIGGRAVVTADGHSAGLHRDPDSASPALILLYRDMLVDVLEGPLITDGYIWWRVRTVGAEPRTGWAIEGAQGRAWVVPVLAE